MDLKKHQSLGKLWVYSFDVFAKIWWRGLLAFLLFFVIGQILSAGLKLFANFFGMGVISGGGDPRGIGVVLGGILLIVFTISQTYTCYFWAILIQMSYKALRKERVSLLEAAGYSFKPAWSLFLVSFLTGLIMLPGILVARKFMVPGVMISLAVWFSVLIRWTYAQGYIVVQESTTLDSLSSSWDLTRGRYADTLLMWLLAGASALAYTFIMLSVALPLVTLIFPRFAIECILASVLGAGMCQIAAFLTAVFVNRDTVANPRMDPQEMENWTPPEIAGDFSNLQPVQEESAAAKPGAENSSTMDKIE